MTMPYQVCSMRKINEIPFWWYKYRYPIKPRASMLQHQTLNFVYLETQFMSLTSLLHGAPQFTEPPVRIHCCCPTCCAIYMSCEATNQTVLDRWNVAKLNIPSETPNTPSTIEFALCWYHLVWIKIKPKWELQFFSGAILTRLITIMHDHAFQDDWYACNNNEPAM